MKEPIIEIRRASESWIMGLVALGILDVSENGTVCKENAPAPEGIRGRDRNG